MFYSIQTLMLKEHGKIDSLLTEFIKNTNSKTFNDFKWMLEKHLFVEEKENLLSKIEEELHDNEEEELLVNEEELFDNEEKLLDTEEELLNTEEELLNTEEELLANEEELLVNEEELMLINYNKKQRAIALQEAYKEKLDVLLKKKNEINIKLDNFNRCGYNLFFNTDSSGLSESVLNKILLLRMYLKLISIIDK